MWWRENNDTDDKLSNNTKDVIQKDKSTVNQKSVG